MNCITVDCPLIGWTQLSGFCLNHFAEGVLAKLIDDQCKADEAVNKAREAMYYVEVAMGLRPRLVPVPYPRELTKASYKTVKEATKRFNNYEVVDDNDDQIDI